MKLRIIIKERSGSSSPRRRGSSIKLQLLIFFSLFLFFFPKLTLAIENFRTDYTVDYFLSEKDNNISSRVSYKIKITNLTPDLVIKNFSILFPKSFQIGNIKAADDFKSIIPSVSDADDKNTISVPLSDPIAGLNSENNIYLDFLQQNLFKVNGNVWEVILPTVENKEGEGDYTIIVHLPPNSGKQISIAKPKPDHITLNEITWRNPVNRTIYAVFGKQQNYSLQLRYHLTNPNLNRVYTDVSFPPDTLYQKVFVNSIRPEPAIVSTDEDGNYIGRYFLNPKEGKTILFDGGVVITSEPREDMKEPIRTLFKTQQKYLLAASTHWKLNEDFIPKKISTIRDIYRYAVDTLTYNYGRLNTSITRLGAQQALQYPDQSVCTEYSDVMISIAREKGLYTREIQGYGFSNDQELRPLSVNADILHSWPEYYDEVKQLWIQTDPTWEDTSGIDYFNSFDLNHVVFAIHGKKSDSPYPAGSYKTQNSTKDINILPTAQYYSELKSVSFETNPLQIPNMSNNSYTLKVVIRNTGNTFLWNFPISAEADKLTLSPATQIVSSLAPLEKKELIFEYIPKSQFGDIKTVLKLSSDSKPLYEQEINVASFYYGIAKIIGIIILFILGLGVAVKLMRR